MLKGIYRLLTDSTFHWRLEEIDMDDLTMTDIGGVLDDPEGEDVAREIVQA